jgi:hypothetical protein
LTGPDGTMSSRCLYVFSGMSILSATWVIVIHFYAADELEMNRL